MEHGMKASCQYINDNNTQRAPLSCNGRRRHSFSKCLVWDGCGRRVREKEHQLTKTNGKWKGKNSENKRKRLRCGLSLGSGLCSRMKGVWWEGSFPGWTKPRGQTPRALGSETSSAQPVGFSGNSVFYFISSPWACIPLLRGRLRASRRSVRISSVLGSLKMPVTVARSCRVISKCVLNGGIKFKATNTLYRGFIIGFGQVVGELGMGRK